jgi:2-amino-4-hydroxy-6-hydroxymethyldihydropteridine diphosphokinase
LLALPGGNNRQYDASGPAPIAALDATAPMPRSYISLGGNLGAVAETFARALDRLQKARGNRVVAVSRFLETTSVGEQPGATFLNAAAAIDTDLPPLEFLDVLQSVEHELGRTREVHWGPRTLDLDIIFYDAGILSLPRLNVPHPAAWYRRFVLDPLVEIAPEFVHPEKLASVELLRARLLRRPLVAHFAGGSPETRLKLIRAMTPLFRDVALQDREGMQQTAVREDDTVLTFWLGPRVGQGESSGDFTRIPLLSRIDASATGEQVEDFVRHVLQSALG